MTGSAALESFVLDLKYAVRSFFKKPGFTLAVVLTTALGIGANTAMFSVIYSVLLKPLEYLDPGRIVLIASGATPVRVDQVTSTARSYSELGAYTNGLEQFALSGSGDPEVLKGARVSANFLSILGVSPLHGRGFLPAEDKPGAPAVVMLGVTLWQRRFGGDLSAVGKTIDLSGTPYVIVGILPPDFQFPMKGADVWVPRPAEWSAISPPSRPLSPTLRVFGRLKPGVSLEQANAELAVIDRQYALTHPTMLDAKPKEPERVRPLQDVLVADVRSKLWLLFGAVGFVQLIVCANMGGLLLARAASRTREFAVRAAIGAGRGRIAGQLLSESMLLATAGGGLGITLASLCLGAIRRVTFVDLPRAGEIHMDAAILGFALVLSALTGVLFGLVPAIVASRTNLMTVLRSPGDGTIGTPRHARFGLRGLLVVGQVGLSVVLLIGATLLIESMVHIYRVDPGFRPDHLLTMSLSLPPTRYPTDERCAAFYAELIRRIEVLPGVRSAALTLTLPMTGWAGSPVQLTSRPALGLNERPISIVQMITPEYFRTLRVPLQRGRSLDERDNATSPPVVVISEALARKLLPQYPSGPSPLGEHLQVGVTFKPAKIVGVVADVLQSGKQEAVLPELYLPMAQHPPGAAMLAVRTATAPSSMAESVRREVLAIDRDQPVSAVSTMDEVVEESEGELRLIMRLLTAFAAAATLLAMIGLYGIVAYSVVQRTKEIGIRRAVGAARSHILGLVLRQALAFSAAGAALGIGTALALTRVVRGLLFQVSPTDPVVFAGVAIVFVGVSLAASYLPAQRATQIDPLEALRL